MPSDPINDLFKEVDIQNKNGFGNWNRDIEGHNRLKTYTRRNSYIIKPHFQKKKKNNNNNNNNNKRKHLK